MEKSLIDILLKLLNTDAASGVIILFLIALVFLLWKYVTAPIRTDIKQLSTDMIGFFKNNKTEQIQLDISDIKEKQKIQDMMFKDLEYIVDFIRNNSAIIDILKEIGKNTKDIILTRDNLNNINQDLIYLRNYLDRNYDNYKNLTELSENIKEVVRYIDANKPNINTKFLENSLAVILESIGDQARTKFDRK